MKKKYEEKISQLKADSAIKKPEISQLDNIKGELNEKNNRIAELEQIIAANKKVRSFRNYKSSTVGMQ